MLKLLYKSKNINICLSSFINYTYLSDANYKINSLIKKKKINLNISRTESLKFK